MEVSCSVLDGQRSACVRFGKSTNPPPISRCDALPVGRPVNGSNADDALRKWVLASTSAQGLPERIADSDLLVAVARMLKTLPQPDPR